MPRPPAPPSLAAAGRLSPPDRGQRNGLRSRLILDGLKRGGYREAPLAVVPVADVPAAVLGCIQRLLDPRHIRIEHFISMQLGNAQACGDVQRPRALAEL